jgi:hypothetical protein
MKPSIFISWEMQTGTEKLAEALILRGFPVEVKKDMITLRNGSQEDYRQLKCILEALNIPVFWNEDQFQLLINQFPLQKMKELIYFHGNEHFVHMGPFHFQWRSFVNRRYGIRTNTIDLCPFTAILVKALNEAGIVTLTGCNGHGNHSPNFQLSGVYNGIWFAIVQQQYMKDLSLNYHWKIQYPAGGSNASIIANKRPDAGWEMNKILADCYQMAQVLISHAAKIRAWKKRSFKRNMKQTAENLRHTGNVQQLFEWMKMTTEAYNID